MIPAPQGLEYGRGSVKIWTTFGMGMGGAVWAGKFGSRGVAVESRQCCSVGYGAGVSLLGWWQGEGSRPGRWLWGVEASTCRKPLDGNRRVKIFVKFYSIFLVFFKAVNV